MPNTNYIVQIQQSQTNIIVSAPMPGDFMFDSRADYEMPLPQGFSNNKPLNTLLAAFGAKLTVQALTAQIWSGSQSSDLSIELEFHTETDPVADVRNPILNLLKLNMPSINSFGTLSQPGPSLDLKKLIGGVSGDITLSSLGSSAASGFGNIVNSVKAAGTALFTGTVPQVAQLNNTSTSSNDGANSAIPKGIQQNPQLGTAAYWKSQVKNAISIRIGNYMFFDSVVITNVQQTFSSNFDAQTGLPHHAKVMVGFRPLFMLTQQDLDQIFIDPTGGSTTGNNAFGFSIPSAPAVANSFGFHL